MEKISVLKKSVQKTWTKVKKSLKKKETPLLAGPPGLQGSIGPKGDSGQDCEKDLPSAPAYPFQECATCENVSGEIVCSEVKEEDKFYILGVRSDNTTYWKRIGY